MYGVALVQQLAQAAHSGQMHRAAGRVDGFACSCQQWINECMDDDNGWLN